MIKVPTAAEKELDDFIAQHSARSRQDSRSRAIYEQTNQHERFAATQARADQIANAFGGSAPRWLDGETHAQYVTRLARKFQPHSPDWKNVDLGALPEKALHLAVTSIFADALAFARSPASVPHGQLRMVAERDQTGRNIHKFIGRDDAAAWRQFSNPDLNVRINTRFD